MEHFTTASANETSALGAAFAARCRRGDVVALFGGLGMGKTAFVKGLVKGLGISADVTSPTFSLVNEYRSESLTVYHFDMYRINSWDDLYSTGFFDYEQTGAVIVTEWSENIENALPDNCFYVQIKKGKNDNVRLITVGRKEEFDEDFGN